MNSAGYFDSWLDLARMFRWQPSKNKYTDWEDPQLILAYRAELDTIYIGVLFERYSHLIFGVCMKYLKDEEQAKDATMQLFEVLTDKLKTHEVQHFQSWLHRVCRNYCLMQLRKAQSRQRHTPAITYEQQQLVESDPDWHLDHDETQESNLLNDAIAQLNEDQRTCVTMFYLKEMSYKEITDSTPYSYNEVKSHIQNGKRNLKKLLSGKL